MHAHMSYLLLLLLAVMVLREGARMFEEATSCTYCGKTCKRHETHCPMRIVEDD